MFFYKSVMHVILALTTYNSVSYLLHNFSIAIFTVMKTVRFSNQISSMGLKKSFAKCMGKGE